MFRRKISPPTAAGDCTEVCPERAEKTNDPVWLLPADEGLVILKVPELGVENVPVITVLSVPLPFVSNKLIKAVFVAVLV